MPKGARDGTGGLFYKNRPLGSRCKISMAFVAFLTLSVLIILYSFAFCYKGTDVSFSQALSTNLKVKVNIIETKEINEDLFVFFKKEDSNNDFGFAMFRKGLNAHYRFLYYSKVSVPFNAAVSILPFSLYGYDGNRRLCLIGGYNCGSISQFGIEIGDWESGDTICIYKIPVEREEFISVIPENTLLKSSNTGEEILTYYRLTARLYDEADNDINDSLSSIKDDLWNGSTAVAEWWILYAGMAVIVLASVVIILALHNSIKKG